MAYILRSSLRYYLTNLNIGSVIRSNVFLRAASPGLNKFLSINYSLPSTQEKGSITVERLLKKLDQDARRMGRLSFKDVHEVVKAVESAQYATVTQSLMLLRCFGNLMIEETPETRTANAIKLWKTLENLGINLDISHYNALLRVYLENFHNFSPSDILADLKERKMEPNRVTYQRLIARYCQMGDLDGAFRILEHMNAEEMPINVNVFNSLILGHSEKNDMKSAEENIRVMKQAGLEPTSESYSILISGYIKQGYLEKAEELMKQCEIKDVVFSEKDYFDIIYAYGKHGYENEIDRILQKMNRGPNYNQEAVNVIYRLVTEGKDVIAFKILKTLVRGTRVDGVVMPIGNFFITHLVKSDIPTEKIFNYCEELLKENMNARALSIAMENALRFGKTECALELFKKAIDKGVTLRPHYFWPLLANYGQKGDTQDLLDLLSRMDKEFSVPFNMETIREYVVPYLLQQKNADISSIILNLRSCGCGVSSAVSSIVINMLLLKNIEKAAEIASLYRAYYPPYLIRKPLESCFMMSKDVESYVTLLKEISAGFDWRSKLDNGKGEDEESHVDGREYTGYMVNDVISMLKKQNSMREISSILKAMLDNGIGIGPDSAKNIKQSLGSSITDELSSLIEKLTSDELSVLASSKNSKLLVSALDVRSLERLYEMMEAKGESTTVVRKQLFSHYGRETNLDKLFELKVKFDQENFELTNGMWAILINAHVEHGKLDEALQMYHEVREKAPDFNLNLPKLLKMALLMVENGRIDGAYELLQSKPVDIEKINDDEFSFVPSASCTKLLNVFAEKGDVENVKKFFDLFITNKLVEVNNILLGPLIKVHIKKDDLDGAMTEFSECCRKYRFTPFKGELTRIFIEKEDAASLQRITDLTTEIHGEMNALYDLAFAFMENGRIRQAKKILQTPGLRIRHDRLRMIAEKYNNEGASHHMENLLKITEDITSVDRSELSHQLLQIYDKANDHKKALSLWLQMQEESVKLSDEFLITLANILERNQLPIPFTVPDGIVTGKPKAHERLRVSPTSQSIRQLLNQEKLDEALKLKDKYKLEQLSKWDWSLLIEACLKENRYKDAVELFEQMKITGQLPHERILKYLFNTASIKGDYELIRSCENMIPKEIKTHVRYNSVLGKAFIVAGKSQEYLDKLEQSLNSVKTTYEFEQFVREFPKVAILELMDKNPELLPRITALLEKVKSMDKSGTLADNILWSYYMTKGEFDEAKKIWDSTFAMSNNKVHFRKITNQISKNANIELGKHLCDFIESRLNTGKGAIGLVRSVLITAYVQNNMVEEALEVLKDGLKKVELEYFSRNVLATLEAACSAKNIDFPYTIPSRESIIQRRRNEANKEDSSDSE